MICGTRYCSVDPSRCCFYVRQYQQTNPKFMGINQDLRYSGLVSATVGGRCVPDLQATMKLKCCSGSLAYGCWPGLLFVALLCIQHGGGAFRRHFLTSSHFSLCRHARAQPHPLCNKFECADVPTLEWRSRSLLRPESFIWREKLMVGDLDNE